MSKMFLIIWSEDTVKNPARVYDSSSRQVGIVVATTEEEAFDKLFLYLRDELPIKMGEYDEYGEKISNYSVDKNPEEKVIHVSYETPDCDGSPWVHEYMYFLGKPFHEGMIYIE